MISSGDNESPNGFFSRFLGARWGYVSGTLLSDFFLLGFFLIKCL